MKRIISVLIMVPLISLVVNAETKVNPTERKPASIERDLIAARINLADVLSKGRIAGKVCDIAAYQSDIMQQLSEVTHMEAFTPSMITADIQQALSGTIAIKELMGQVKLDHKSTAKDFEKALLNTYFEGPGMGVYGPRQWMTFKSGGKVDVTFLNVLDQEPWTSETKATGTWGVNVTEEKNGRLVRVWFTVNGKTKAYRIEKSFEDQGLWILKSKETPGKQRYQIYKFFNFKASECEA